MLVVSAIIGIREKKKIMWSVYILSFKLVEKWSNWSKALFNFFAFLLFEL